MENKTMVSNNVEFACDLADQMLDLDYYEKEECRFEQFYNVIMEALDNAED